MSPPTALRICGLALGIATETRGARGPAVTSILTTMPNTTLSRQSQDQIDCQSGLAHLSLDSQAMLALWPLSVTSVPPPPWPWETIELESNEIQWIPTDYVLDQGTTEQLLRRNGFGEYEPAIGLAKKICPTEECLVNFVLKNIQNLSGHCGIELRYCAS